MGASASYESDDTIQIVEGFYSFVNESMAKATANATYKTGSRQSTDVTQCGPKCNSPSFKNEYCIIEGDVYVGQNSSLVNRIEGAAMSDVVADIKNDLQVRTDQFIKEQTENHTEWFTVALNVLQRSNETINSITTKMINSISSDTSAVCAGESEVSETVSVLICGIVKGKVQITQNAFQANTLSCITKQVIAFTVNNKALSDAIQAADLATKNGGSNFWTYIIIGIIVLIVIFIILALVKSFNPAPEVKPPPRGRPPAKLPSKVGIASRATAF